MANPAQVEQLVRFSLNTLRARNAHHVFEEVCWHVAKHRLTPNILPATGPVSAGGDQGRDFETFRSFGVNSDTRASVVADAGIAFACTLQQEDVRGKVARDLVAITSSGTPVSTVVYFLEVDVPVGVRHDIQDAARDAHGIELEIFDGRAIASLLAERTMFWIAEQYLSVPSEIYPEIDEDEEDWYAETRQAWLVSPSSFNYGSFVALKEAARYALNTGKDTDLAFWIDRLDGVAERIGAGRLHLAATYESLVITLRGQGNLSGREDQIRAYFAESADADDVGDLEDRQIFLTYCGGALSRGLVNLGWDELEAWREATLAQIGRVAGDARDDATRCYLLMLRANVQIVSPMRVEGPSERGLEDAFETWFEILDLLPGAALFPVDRLSRITGALTLVISEHPQYRELTRRLDAAVSQMAGRAAAAERCRDRALLFYEADRYQRALQEFHDARIEWFTGDTLRGSLLATGLIANCYQRLHLYMAAKYYYLALATLPFEVGTGDERDLAPSGLLGAAGSDFNQGSWLRLLDLIPSAVQLHALLQEDPWNADRHDSLRHLFVSLSTCYAVARQRLPADVPERLEAMLRELDLFDIVSEGERIISDAHPDAFAFAHREIGNAPFNDAGPTRTITWKALGIVWHVTFDNAYDVTLIGEQFAAIAQIVLAELAPIDLSLLPTRVEIEVALSDEAELAQRPSNEEQLWLVAFDRSALAPSLSDVFVHTLLSIFRIAAECSVLPDIDRVLSEHLRDDLLQKVVVASPYSVLAAYWVGEERWSEQGGRESLQGLDEHSEPLEADELQWIDTLGPTYSEARALEMTSDRYDAIWTYGGETIRTAVADDEIRRICVELRDEGYLDWHVLGALLSVAMNYRIELERPGTMAERRLLADKYLQHEDPAWPVVPLSEFTEEAIRRQILLNSLSSFQRWDLAIHQQTPDFDAALRFLRVRYRHFADDAPHEAIF